MEEEPLAEGGFGAVYKAKWSMNDVVVKMIKVRNEKERKDAMEEASLTISLHHPNVIKLYGIARVKKKKLGIVMELAERGSLDQWIGKIDQDKMKKIALGIIAGLKYVHAQNVIHRDIKPRNILMFGPKDDMVPKIADFGVSKLIQTAAVTHTRVGQELYMAPEVSKLNHYSFPADIFSLAMTLFELFNEQLIPDSSAEVGQFVLNIPNGTIGELPSSCKVPKDLYVVIKRGWSLNHDQRPQLSEYYSSVQG